MSSEGARLNVCGDSQYISSSSLPFYCFTFLVSDALDNYQKITTQVSQKFSFKKFSFVIQLTDLTAYVTDKRQLNLFPRMK